MIIFSILIQKGLVTTQSKIEKVPRGIQGEKSSKDMASSRNHITKIFDYTVIQTDFGQSFEVTNDNHLVLLKRFIGT